ncbi:MAG: 4-hydroxy-3-methylbut-2-enyl diphosphate reductase, partial [Gemmatimonadota bacterium]
MTAPAPVPEPAGTARQAAAGPAPVAAAPAAAPAGLVVCAPLRLEARAIRRGVGTRARVVQTGYGPRRSTRQASRLQGTSFGMLAVTGVGGGLTGDLSPGDLVVASEVTDGTRTVACPSAPLLAGELRRAGLAARAGRVVSVDRLAAGQQRQQLAAGGAIVADLESAQLAAAANGRPLAVFRAVSDTPQRPLLRPGAFTGGLAALRSLRGTGPVLSAWAAACGPRQVLLAGPRSFCAGVERAIEIVERVLAQH